MSATDRDAAKRFEFTRREVAGEPCPCCHRRQPTVKVFVWRSDHPDGRYASFTSFTPGDLKTFVREAAEYLNLEVRSRWPYGD